MTVGIHITSSGADMLTSNVKTVRNDMKTLMRDAQELFREATAATGEKADELRQKGMTMVDTAMAKAQELQSAAIQTGKEMAETADGFCAGKSLAGGGDFGRRRIVGRLADRAQVIVWRLRNQPPPTAPRVLLPVLPGLPRICSACC